jgi:hypothetical protein
MQLLQQFALSGIKFADIGQARCNYMSESKVNLRNALGGF